MVFAAPPTPALGKAAAAAASDEAPSLTEDMLAGKTPDESPSEHAFVARQAMARPASLLLVVTATATTKTPADAALSSV
jgi:hypothetical protein